MKSSTLSADFSRKVGIAGCQIEQEKDVLGICGGGVWGSEGGRICGRSGSGGICNEVRDGGGYIGGGSSCS